MDPLIAGFDGLRGVLVGGAATPASLIERGLEAGLPLLATYGLTETCSQVATVSPGAQRDAMGTVGRPLAGFDVQIDGGVIVVSGSAVSPGYWREAPREGPLVTNDLGSFDAAGRLIVHGRRDAVIITGGENVNPERVEAALVDHPSVVDAGVFGVPDPDWGEMVVAHIVWSEAPDDAGLAEHLGTVLERWEIPKRFEPVEALPRTASGKLDRDALAAGVTGA